MPQFTDAYTCGVSCNGLYRCAIRPITRKVKSKKGYFLPDDENYTARQLEALYRGWTLYTTAVLGVRSIEHEDDAYWMHAPSTETVENTDAEPPISQQVVKVGTWVKISGRCTMATWKNCVVKVGRDDADLAARYPAVNASSSPELATPSASIRERDLIMCRRLCCSRTFNDRSARGRHEDLCGKGDIVESSDDEDPAETSYQRRVRKAGTTTAGFLPDLGIPPNIQKECFIDIKAPTPVPASQMPDPNK